MPRIINILHLEDDPKDAKLVRSKLESDDWACKIQLVQSKADFENALRSSDYDIILADYNVPGYHGVDALRFTLANQPDIPFIFVSGAIGEDAAIEGLTQGATDYVLKQKMSRLIQAVKRALNESEIKKSNKRAERALKEKTEELNRYFSSALDLLCIADTEGYFIRLNPQWEPTLGYPISELEGRKFLDFVHPDDLENTLQAISMLNQQKEVLNFINRYRCKNGDYKWIEWRSLPEDNRIYAVARDITDRKETELKLKESEERLRLTLEATQIGIWDWDVKNDKWLASPIYYTMLGYEPKSAPVTRDEWLGQVHPEDRRFVNRKFQDVLSPDFNSYEYEARLLHADGSYRWQSVKGFVIGRDGKGNISRMLGIRIDIDEKKKAEEKLRRLNRELRAISNCNQALLRAENEMTLLNEICRIICEEAGYKMAWVGFAVHNDTKNILPVSWAGVEVDYIEDLNLNWTDTGKGTGPVGTAIRTGQTTCIQDISADPSTSPWRDKALKHSLNSCIALPLLNEKMQAFGALAIYTSETGIFDADEKRLLEELAGDLAFGLITLRMKDERERAEKDLRKLSRAVEQSPVSIVITDVEGNIEYVNSRFTHVTGFSKEEALGQNPRILKSGYMMPQIYEDMWNTISSGKVWNGEFHNKRKNGELYWELASISPIIDRSGKITNFLAVKEDITKIKRTEKELIEAKEKAEESDKLKTSFLCNMSHEIRTPMNAIIGFSDFLFDLSIPIEKRQYFSEIIKSRSYDLLRIIDDILDTSKLEVGQMSIVEQSVNISKLLLELLEYYKLRINNSKKAGAVEVILDVDDNLKGVYVFSDEHRLKQVLNNLLENAFKFTHKGSIKFGCKFQDDMDLLFYVSDTGIGIPEDKQSIIFDPFRQAEDLMSEREYGGTGLGLSIVKGIVTLLNGKIWVTSKLHKGSTFYFTLPFIESPVKESVVSHTPYNYKWGNKTVLIVEDDLANSEHINWILSGKGLRVLFAFNGEEALNIVEANPGINLILMDIRLPDVNGLTVTRLIRQKFFNLPIIAQTAYVSVDDLKECIAAGCNNYISKPINKNKLLALVDHYLKES